MLAIFTLVTSEFLPASLVPMMAADFGITEGVAGQVVTATAIVGMITGPGIALLFPASTGNDSWSSCWYSRCCRTF